MSEKDLLIVDLHLAHRAHELLEANYERAKRADLLPTTKAHYEEALKVMIAKIAEIREDIRWRP